MYQAQAMANQSAADLFRRPMGFQLFNDKLAQFWVTSELAQPRSAVFADIVGNNAMITLFTGSNLLHLLEKHGYIAKIDLRDARETLRS